jgi:hypothetical protein
VSTDAEAPSIWVRAIADGRFRAALIEDPLRALAGAGPVRVSPEQVAQLDEMSVDERRALITDIVREAHVRGAQARFGRIGSDGRIGGPDNPTIV